MKSLFSLRKVARSTLEASVVVSGLAFSAAGAYRRSSTQAKRQGQGQWSLHGKELNGLPWLIMWLWRLRREIDRKQHRKCPRPPWKAWSRKHSLLLFLAEREAPPENQTLREALRPGANLSALRRFSSRFLL